MEDEWAQEATGYQEDQAKKCLAVGTGEVVMPSANNIRRSSTAGRAGVVLHIRVHIHLYIMDVTTAKPIVVKPLVHLYYCECYGCEDNRQPIAGETPCPREL